MAVTEPLFVKIDIAPNTSFGVRGFKKLTKHFHPEYELTYVKKGYGKRYMAGRLEDFGPGDLVLIGKNVPHHYIKNDTEEHIEIIAIHFKESVLGGALFSSPEFDSIGTLLEKSSSGIAFGEKANKPVRDQIEKIASLTHLDRAIAILKILSLLANSKDFRFIGEIGFMPKIPKLSQRDFDRMNLIFEYVEKNYGRHIELKEMEELAHMSTSAFCRYFKKVTGKSFVSFVNEYRIGRACKLLIESDMDVGEISYKSGFNSIANFNRKFKSILKTSPLKYRKSLAVT